MASVGDRWTLLVVEALLEGPLRFGQVSDVVGGIAPNVLTARLRHLEQEGVVVSRRYSERPPRLVYELSASGRELAGALALLGAWGARRNGDDAARHHGACGTALEVRWFCPTCDRVVDEDDAGEVRHL